MMEEGCLNIPEHYINIERPREIMLSSKQERVNIKWKLKGLQLFLRIVPEYEVDHLDGKLMTDYE